MDQRALPGMIAGATGLLAGAIGAALDLPALAAAAALCAIAAGLASLNLMRELRAAEREAATAIELMIAKSTAPTTEGEPPDVMDSETGLPGETFFDLAVRGRIAAARRHLWPVSVVLLEIGLSTEPNDEAGRASAIKAFQDLMRQTLRESDIACRIGPSTFGLILEDTAEEGGVWTAERLQIALSKDVTRVRRLAAGVASYPTHALHAEDVLRRAHSALARAAAFPPGHGFGQVEVAHVDLS